jgi:HD superfamily phosphodiesterase
MLDKCPGRDSRKAEAENIDCPVCGYVAEIFSDEIKVHCPSCHNLICRQRLPRCLDWCKAAKECLGEEQYRAYQEGRSVILKDKLIKELEDYFGKDIKRINHAKKVLGFAETILQEEQADWHVVIPASILHDVGIKIAEEDCGSSAGHLQEKFGPEIARKILLKLGVNKENIEEICLIIGNHHSPGKIDTLNFKVLSDSDWLVNLKEEAATNDRAVLAQIIEKVFLTETGRQIAKKSYL